MTLIVWIDLGNSVKNKSHYTSHEVSTEKVNGFRPLSARKMAKELISEHQLRLSQSQGILITRLFLHSEGHAWSNILREADPKPIYRYFLGPDGTKRCLVPAKGQS